MAQTVPIWASVVTLQISHPIENQRKAPLALRMTQFGRKSYLNRNKSPNLVTLFQGKGASPTSFVDSDRILEQEAVRPD